MTIEIGSHDYKTGFWYRHGTWALVTRRMILNNGYFLR